MRHACHPLGHQDSNLWQHVILLLTSTLACSCCKLLRPSCLILLEFGHPFRFEQTNCGLGLGGMRVFSWDMAVVSSCLPTRGGEEDSRLFSLFIVFIVLGLWNSTSGNLTVLCSLGSAHTHRLLWENCAQFARFVSKTFCLVFNRSILQRSRMRGSNTLCLQAEFFSVEVPSKSFSPFRSQTFLSNPHSPP